MAGPHVLPTFLVIGAMKAGTTSLHDWLGRHPDCFVSAQKELNHWSLPYLHDQDRGLEGYGWHFKDAADVPVRGEASPTYTMWPWRDGVPAVIAANLPDVRLVYLVRDPVARAHSHYLHMVAKGLETRPVDQAIRADARYVELSSYALQISRYLPHFAAEQLLVVCTERLDDPVSLASICRHLGLDPDRAPTETPGHLHVTSEKQRVRPWAYRAETRPFVRSAVAAAPERLRSSWLRATRTPLTGFTGPMSSDTVGWLQDRLRDDVAALRPWLPNGHDGWGLLTT